MIRKKEKILSKSLFSRRWRKFKSIKYGYYSLRILIYSYLFSFLLPLFVGNDALIVKYNGTLYFPLFKYFPASVFKQTSYAKDDTYGKPLIGEPNYRWLKKQFQTEDSENFVLLPLYPYSAEESLLDELSGNPPIKPSSEHLFGIDNKGRDIFARILYGFRISVSFGVLVTLLSYITGVIIGAVLGFFGRKIDLFGQRLIEIWSMLPIFYILVIVSAVFNPGFLLLTIIFTVFGWMGISYYIRGEFYREKNKDYFLTAVSAGVPNHSIIVRHILPNALTPVISFAPFAIIANISSLVALDYLGFGLPPPVPSWGELLHQGMGNIHLWWLIVFPLLAVFLTLLLLTLIGEAVRESFSPMESSGLK